MSRSSTRAGRVADEIRREVADIVRTQLKDPRVQALVTFTGVELSTDLAYAKIFFTVLGDRGSVQSAAEGLQSAAGYIRTELGHRMRLRVVPHISFAFDESVIRGVELSALIDKANASHAQE